MEISDQIQSREAPVWNNIELDVLRKHSKETTKCLQLTEIKLETASEELVNLQANNKALTENCKDFKDQLASEKKINMRLLILINNLKKTTNTESAKAAFLREEIKKKQIALTTKDKEISKLNITLKREQLQNNKMIQDKTEQQQHHSVDLMCREQKVLSQTEKKINVLEDKLTALERQLTDEKTDHQRTKFALTHLQKHFGSAVNKDEVTQWTY